MSSITVMPIVRTGPDATRSCLAEIINAYLQSEGIPVTNMKSITDFVATIAIAAPASKSAGRRKRSPEEIEEAERIKREKKEARDAERLAKKEAKAAEKAAAKEAKAAAKAAKAASKGEWFTAVRLKNPDGGADPKGKNGANMRYQIHRTSGECQLKNEANWTDEGKTMLEKVLLAKKTKKPDMMKAVKAVAKKQVSPKKSAAKKTPQQMKAAQMRAVKARKAAKAAKAAEAAEAARVAAEAAAAAENELDTEEFEMDEMGEMDAEGFADNAATEVRKPFTWDKNPEMELWEDGDRWVWDGTGEDANPVCYYDEEDQAYVVAPGSDELLA